MAWPSADHRPDPLDLEAPGRHRLTASLDARHDRARIWRKSRKSPTAPYAWAISGCDGLITGDRRWFPAAKGLPREREAQFPARSPPLRLRRLKENSYSLAIALQLIGGTDRTSLPAGSYKHSFDWRLRPLVAGSLRISVQATAGRLRQRSEIPVEIETDA